MANNRRLLTFVGLAGCLLWLAFFGSAGWTQQRPTAKFATPRETLKTLYFSIIAYDFHPALIDDAIACLEQAPDQARDVAEAARLAIELDAILRELCLPVYAVSENPPGENLVVCEG